MKDSLKQFVIEEFSSDHTQREYISKADEGLWISEDFFLRKHFTSGGRVLDIGCGTGRTTIALREIGFDVIGIDMVPAMISNAKKIAAQKNLDINYRDGDAINLEFEDGFFDYALFSNQGWTQTPGESNRLRSLREVRRVLKDGGIFIFTAHPRVIPGNVFFWAKKWIRFFIMKPLGFNIREENFGDRFFLRRSSDGITEQYIHIPTIRKVKRAIRKAGFKLLEVNGQLQISHVDIRKHPPVFYVCQKLVIEKK